MLWRILQRGCLVGAICLGLVAAGAMLLERLSYWDPGLYTRWTRDGVQFGVVLRDGMMSGIVDPYNRATVSSFQRRLFHLEGIALKHLAFDAGMVSLCCFPGWPNLVLRNRLRAHTPGSGFEPLRSESPRGRNSR